MLKGGYFLIVALWLSAFFVYLTRIKRKTNYCGTRMVKRGVRTKSSLSSASVKILR